jgi:hypothetical protein
MWVLVLSIVSGGYLNFRVGVYRSTPNHQPGELGTISRPDNSTCLAWAALPQAYTPTRIAFRASGVCKFTLNRKTVVLEEKFYNIF